MIKISKPFVGRYLTKRPIRQYANATLKTTGDTRCFRKTNALHEKNGRLYVNVAIDTFVTVRDIKYVSKQPSAMCVI